MEEREYEGGEHKTRPLVSVRGRDVFVVQSLSGDAAGSANDRLCRLLFFIAGLKDSGAASVTACVPFLCYGRKDRRTKERDPVTLRYVAQLFEAVGTDHVLALDAHNLAAFESAFRCPVDQLEAAPMLARHLCRPVGRRAGDDRVAGLRRCEARAARGRLLSRARGAGGRFRRASRSVAAAAWSAATCW